MYVYMWSRVSNQWEVEFYKPDGSFYTSERWNDKEDAMSATNYLNGGR